MREYDRWSVKYCVYTLSKIQFLKEYKHNYRKDEGRYVRIIHFFSTSPIYYDNAEKNQLEWKNKVTHNKEESDTILVQNG